MKIGSCFITLKKRIETLDKMLSAYKDYPDLYNPFTSMQPKTYVWVDKPETDSELN